MMPLPIIKYNTPVGEYVINENMEIYFNNKLVVDAQDTVHQAKQIVYQLIDKERKIQVQSLQIQLGKISDMNSDIEVYRINPNF